MQTGILPKGYPLPEHVERRNNATSSANLKSELPNELQGFALGDHRQKARILFTVEGCLGGRRAVTDLCLLFGRVEPEAYIEGMDRVEGVGRVLDKGLLIEDALNPDGGVAVGVALEIRLVPAKAKAGEGTFIQRRILDQEQIEGRILGQPAGRQDHDIILCARDKPIGDGDMRLCMLDSRAGEGTGQQAWVHVQLERAGCPVTSILSS